MAFSRLVQVSNLSTHCTKEQLTTLFSYVGPLEESVIYPEGETLTSTVGTKVGYIRFTRSESARIAIHLTNIIFVEKQLIVSYVLNGRIPDEADAIKYCAPLNPNITLIAGGPTWNSTIINRVVGQGINAEIETMDHELNERHLPPYPNLPGSLDHCKAEEIRRTVYVSSIDRSVTLEMLEEFVSQIGEVRYIRAAFDKSDDETQDAYVEFAEQHSVPRALCLNGFFLISCQIEVNHAMLGVSKATSLTAPIPEIIEASNSMRSRSTSRHPRSRSTSQKRRRSGSRHRSRSDSFDHKRRHHRDISPSHLRQRSPSYHCRSNRYYYYGSNRPRSPPPGYYDRFYARRRRGFAMPPVYRRDQSPFSSTMDRFGRYDDHRNRRLSPIKRSRSPHSSKTSSRRDQSSSPRRREEGQRSSKKSKSKSRHESRGRKSKSTGTRRRSCDSSDVKEDGRPDEKSRRSSSKKQKASRRRSSERSGSPMSRTKADKKGRENRMSDDASDHAENNREPRTRQKSERTGKGDTSRQNDKSRKSSRNRSRMSQEWKQRDSSSGRQMSKESSSRDRQTENHRERRRKSNSKRSQKESVNDRRVVKPRRDGSSGSASPAQSKSTRGKADDQRYASQAKRRQRSSSRVETPKRNAPSSDSKNRPSKDRKRNSRKKHADGGYTSTSSESDGRRSQSYQRRRPASKHRKHEGNDRKKRRQLRSVSFSDY